MSGFKRAKPDDDAEDVALAIAFKNLKGLHDKDLLATAAALQTLKDLPRFGSNRAVAAAVGVSPEIVREFISLLSLPKSVLKLFEQRDLSTLEQGRRLAQLQRRRPGVVEDAAAAMVGLTAHGARDLAEYLVRHRQAAPLEALEAIESARTRVRTEYHVVAVVDEAEYRALEREAKSSGVSVDRLVTGLVREWLDARATKGRSR